LRKNQVANFEQICYRRIESSYECGESAKKPSDLQHQNALAFFTLPPRSRKEISMQRTLDTIVDVIRNRKHPFPQLGDRPNKQHKNRYERRKIKQFIHLGDWAVDAEAP
jgi:hypothetical protein